MKAVPHTLIVDDHRETRELVSRVLSREWFRVSVSAEGKATRRILADIRIDRVRLDLMLLGEDGLFLFGAIRMLTAKGKKWTVSSAWR